MHDQIFDVFGIGAIAIDFIGTVNGWPAPGSKNKLNSISIEGGGLTATALTAVARLGGKAAIAANLGFSLTAETAINHLKEDGVDITNVIRKEGSEPVRSFILSEEGQGERTIFFSRDNVSYPSPEAFPDHYWYERSKVLIVDHGTGKAGYETALIANENRLPVIIDAERMEPELDLLLGVSDHIILNKKFGSELTGKNSEEEILNSLRSDLNKTIILTRGAEGLTGIDQQGIFNVPAFKVPVRDTIGCGDVFHGAYALGIARNWEPRKCSIYASAAAALSATQTGGRRGIPSGPELAEFVKNEHPGFLL